MELNKLQRDIILRESRALLGPNISERARFDFIPLPESKILFDVYDPQSNKGITIALYDAELDLSLSALSERVLRPAMRCFADAIEPSNFSKKLAELKEAVDGRR